MKSKDKNIFAWDRAKVQEKNLTRWIEALISGKYKQGVGKLYNPDTGCHCATGVALREFGFSELGGVFYFGFEADRFTQLWSDHSVPEKWYNATFGMISPWYVVTHLNDGWWSTGDRTFAEIAAHLIEFLPESPKRTELQFQIADVLQSEAASGQTKHQEKS